MAILLLGGLSKGSLDFFASIEVRRRVCRSMVHLTTSSQVK